MKKLILIPFISVSITACSPPAPEILAKESCDCFTKAKSNHNSDNQAEAISSCMEDVQTTVSRIRQIEKDEDMTDEQAKAYEDRFYKVYDNCK